MSKEPEAENLSSWHPENRKIFCEHYKRGSPADVEQDLLRAMLLFGSAGLDSVIKQLVRDALPTVVEKDPGANAMLENFAQMRLKTTSDPLKQTTVDTVFLAKLLTSNSSRGVLLNESIRQLTMDSLQSKEQLLRVAANFAITPGELTTNVEELKKIFDARNQITHEMDIDFSARNRKRRSRKLEDMLKFTNEILKVAENFILIVDGKCS